VEAVPDSSIKKLSSEFKKYKSKVDAKMVLLATELGAVYSSVCTIMQLFMERLPAKQNIEKKETEKQEKQLEETEEDENEPTRK
jgi:hypothetical protein